MDDDIYRAVRLELDRLRAENAELRAELLAAQSQYLENTAHMQSLLTPCRPDTNAQTDPAYPATVNDVLHLLSCYWADFLPDDVELPDEYFAAWERQARPVIERLTDR